jgi:hypothetical protein
LNTILKLKEEYIEQMGIPLGHKLKIIKKVRQLNEEIFKEGVIKNEMDSIKPPKGNLN